MAILSAILLALQLFLTWAHLPLKAQAILTELSRRHGALAALNPVQRDAMNDKSLYRAWQCSRRAGKTTTAITEFFVNGSKNPNAEYAYIALTATSAKRIVWKILRRINDEFGYNARFRESEMRVELPNGAALSIYGADRPDWMDRLYGQELWAVWVDEAAFFSVDMEYLVYDVLEPCVTDRRGPITLMSKPGHICHGLFHEICTGADNPRAKGWSIKKWDWKNNKHIAPQTRERLLQRAKIHRDYLKLPATRRNWFNEWVVETGKLVYKFDPKRNKLRIYKPAKENQIVLGIDLGWNDATAFVVMAWSKRHKKVVVLESFKERRMLMDDIASRVEMYLEAYPGLDVVCDRDQRRIFMELRSRYDLPISSAEKSDKKFWIDQVNNDLIAGDVLFVNPEMQPVVEEMVDLLWRERPNGDLVEDPRLPNDCCDALLYAFRWSEHYRAKGFKPGKTEAELLEERIEASLEEEQDEDGDGEYRWA